MPRYLLEGMINEWIYEADNEESATKQFIHEICGAKTIEDYQKYCKEVGVSSEVEWWGVPEGLSENE